MPQEPEFDIKIALMAGVFFTCGSVILAFDIETTAYFVGLLIGGISGFVMAYLWYLEICELSKSQNWPQKREIGFGLSLLIGGLIVFGARILEIFPATIHDFIVGLSGGVTSTISIGITLAIYLYNLRSDD